MVSDRAIPKLCCSVTNTAEAIPAHWPFKNETAKDVQTHLLTDVYMEALRELAPDTGSYLNEVSRNDFVHDSFPLR
jgi:hypothetical protein